MPDITDNQELMDAFYQEAQALIDEMRKDVSTLGEARVPTIPHRLFRYAHTLKTSSGIVGFDDLHEVIRALTKTFKAAEDEKFSINADAIALLSDSIEVCQKLLNKEEVVGYEEFLARLDNFPEP